MTESQFTQKLLKALRAHPVLRGSIVFKHNDRTTRGIPDFSITMGTKTLWAEVKRYPACPTKIQSYFMNKIGVGCLLITDHRNGNVALWQLGDTVALYKFDALVEEIVRRVVNC